MADEREMKPGQINIELNEEIATPEADQGTAVDRSVASAVGLVGGALELISGGGGVRDVLLTRFGRPGSGSQGHHISPMQGIRREVRLVEARDRKLSPVKCSHARLVITQFGVDLLGVE